MVEAKKVILVDISYPLLIDANKRRNKNMVVICGDIQTIPLKIKGDLVICTHVLEHLPNPRQALNNFNKLLNESGKIYLATPVLNLPFQGLIRRLFRKYLFIRYKSAGFDDHLRVYSTKTLTKDINDAGFAVDEIMYTPVLGWSFLQRRYLDKLFAMHINLICSKRRGRKKQDNDL